MINIDFHDYRHLLHRKFKNYRYPTGNKLKVIFLQEIKKLTSELRRIWIPNIDK
jgi:hypothetical protein